MSRLQEFYDELETLNNASNICGSSNVLQDIENTYYLGVIAKQLCELTDILIEYKEGINNNK